MSSTTRLNPTPSPSYYRTAAPPSLSAIRSNSTTRSNQLEPFPSTNFNQQQQPNVNDGILRSNLGFNRRSESLDILTTKKAKKELRSLNDRSSNNKKGKNRAVAFVVGTTSSGSGDEGDSSEPEVNDNINELNQEVYRRDSGVDDFVKWQIRQPIQTIDPLDLDSLLPLGIGDYTYVLSPINSPSSSKSPNSPTSSNSNASTSTSTHSYKPTVVSLGKGKFSEVLLVTKGETEYALKHTPLHPHHPLIATRLLREPTILAQLKPHPNLIKVFETIRTPGHFYLVEENLRSSITLESLVASSKTGMLDSTFVWDILEQLASVVHSLHEPLRVCHRDIKPENILVRVLPVEEGGSTIDSPKVILKLLDFGLATHYSSSEAKLTTCCGSPAYHSPELWRGLREPSGTVRYWGPEVDIWCLGLTLLRCVTPNKYPLGISHSSMNALSDKVVDALLGIEDEKLRRTLAGFMHMDGSKRMRFFDKFCVGLQVRKSSVDLERDSITSSGLVIDEDTSTLSSELKKEFKTTSFVPTEVRHSLDLPISTRKTGIRSLESVANGIGSRSPSRTRLDVSSRATSRTTSRATSRTPRHRGDSSLLSSAAPSPIFDFKSLPQFLPSTGPSSALPSPELATDFSTNWAILHDSLPSTPATPNYHQSSHLPYPPPIELYLSNPTDEPIRRATSYIKYALRCAGILYHVRTDISESGFSSFNAPILQTSSSINSISNNNGNGTTGVANDHSSNSAQSSSVESPLPFNTFKQLEGVKTIGESINELNAGGEEEDPTDFITYLQCVIELPEITDVPSKASSALIAALKPSIIRAHSTPPIGKNGAAASAGGNGSSSANSSKKKKDVKALVFFISISKAPSRSRSSNRRSQSHTRSAQPSNTVGIDESQKFEQQLHQEGEGTATPKPTSNENRKKSNRRRKSGDKIVITFSDERAVQSVKDALKGDSDNNGNSSTLVDKDGFNSVSTTGSNNNVDLEGEDRRGRKSRASSNLVPLQQPSSITDSTNTSTTTPTSTKSSSRIRRTDSNSTTRNLNRTSSSPVGSGKGLGMAMGPPQIPTPSNLAINPTNAEVGGAGGGGGGRFFDFAFGRFGKTQSASNLAGVVSAAAELKLEDENDLVRSRAAAIAMGGAMF